jgi:ketosteroid isomerase-like protein
MPHTEILTAAADLIIAFEANDRAGYFAAFTPEASFIFHNVDRVLASRAAYEAEYDSWVREDGFQVLECTSTCQNVQVYGDTAIFTHQTFTRILTHEGESAAQERETIVFHKTGSGWLAVHEHLSPLPE